MENLETLEPSNQYISIENNQEKVFDTCLDLSKKARKQCHQLLDYYPVDSKAKTQLMTLITRLRAANRVAYLEARASKQETQRARQSLDQKHVQLQNLYYEQQHILATIKACETFPTMYNSLSMISEEEFLALHPNFNTTDQHALMLARLSYEKKERENLEKVRRDLLKQKSELISQNKTHKEDLETLDFQLKNFIRVSHFFYLNRSYLSKNAEPLQEFMKKY
ncbi:hypothetical protein T552_00607 [Pneumocystis carinii B80]|uniref:THO complex subunit 5 n=1 Tax=Pneumocystis carinii (strain B80) TaxID=1408658 RepID=A0A0W4ZP58_PNEC8|nr:hypothetical protein T552_00607 [Pneumocystis carinii B80]KTW30129.1 hypothetical protein T552_00607 [Pneumocystis carinii B80]